jgi:hypothetical protein
MKYLIAVIAVIATTFALKASARCPFTAPDTMPSIPDGASASTASMQDAMVEVRAYVRTSEKFLDCRGSMLSSSHYSEVFDNAALAANAFNTQLARFRERNDTLASN